MRLFIKLTTCPNKRLCSFLGSTLRTIPALRAGIVRADKREFIAHAARNHAALRQVLIRTLGFSYERASISAC